MPSVAPRRIPNSVQAARDVRMGWSLRGLRGRTRPATLLAEDADALDAFVLEAHELEAHVRAPRRAHGRLAGLDAGERAPALDVREPVHALDAVLHVEHEQPGDLHLGRGPGLAVVVDDQHLEARAHGLADRRLGLDALAHE